MRPDEDTTHRVLAELNPAIVRGLAEAHDGIRRFLFRSLRNREDAEDVMQDFYARVLSRSSQLRKDESARVWLRRVLRSVFNDYLRRWAARGRAEADFARKEAATPPAEQEFDTQACLCLHKLLPALKQEYAEVLRRVDLEEEPPEAAAAALGITINNLLVRLHRARRGLRRLLELSCETCPIHGFLDCGCEYSRKLRSASEV